MATGPRLLGRDDEIERLDRVIADLRDGAGSTLVLVGDAGIGKTALLEEVCARSDGAVAVLRAAGIRSEAEIAFSGLSGLLENVVEYLSLLPTPQAAALASALAMGPPVPGDRLAICVATIGLLRAAAASRPVLVVVDDVPWLDAPSRECVLYAARRAAGDMAFLLAARTGDADPIELAELAQITLEPLSSLASHEVLAGHSGMASWVADAVVAEAAGNPLALKELPATLRPDQVRGIEALPRPLMPGARLYATFAQRVQGLSREARRALLVSALHDGDDLTTIAAACSRFHTDITRLTAAEEAGLVRLDGLKVVFNHPLMRGAVARVESPADRRTAHRALADVVTGERRAWHLGGATVAPDEEVALELERAAGAAAARRGFSSAALALERAARLSPVAADRARRLLAAGQTAAAAGQPARSSALLDEALADAESVDMCTRIHHLRAATMIWTGEAGAAIELLENEAGRAAAETPVLAARMLADAATACTAVNEYARAEVVAERAVATLADAEDLHSRAHVTAVRAYVLALRGRITRARAELAVADELAAGIDPLVPGNTWLHLIERTRAPVGAPAQALARAMALCDRARAAGAVTALAGSLVVGADAAFRLGDWALADAASCEALQVSEDAGQQVWRGMALTLRARLLAARGQEPASRELLQTATTIADQCELSSGHRFVNGALGFLELGLGRVAEAIAVLEGHMSLGRRSGLREVTIVPWIPDLIEAYVREDRRDDANRLIDLLQDHVIDAPPSACALLARCRGIAAESDFDALFAEALALDDACPAPFERARTLLAWGRRLHRSRRRALARSRLEEALEMFEGLGAVAWAAQARDELSAATSRRVARPGDLLTAQEERVAAEVARGASNHDIGATLFLAPKTVEFHLSKLYRKLGVGSRAQLVAVLARRPDG